MLTSAAPPHPFTQLHATPTSPSQVEPIHAPPPERVPPPDSSQTLYTSQPHLPEGGDLLRHTSGSLGGFPVLTSECMGV